MREVVLGVKNNLRNSASRDAQISVGTWYWFVPCELQIFLGYVCHIEQPHVQSPFLFPIVLGISLIPFFDYWLSTCWPFASFVCWVCAPVLGPLCGHNYCCCCFGNNALVFHCELPRQNSPLPPKCNPLSNRSVLHDGIKQKTVVLSESNAVCE